MSMIQSGLYIVTLNNEQPISVNAQDPRIADKATKTTDVAFGYKAVFLFDL